MKEKEERCYPWLLLNAPDSTKKPIVLYHKRSIIPPPTSNTAYKFLVLLPRHPHHTHIQLTRSTAITKDKAQNRLLHLFIAASPLFEGATHSSPHLTGVDSYPVVRNILYNRWHQVE
ncbi:hypothetical protein BDZ91DRAFT_716802 [Kalaharituber pfeilii]|nr:hypothetical protein BDZ91DRAFT_716802 [Kalaharituber pfeilii]